MERFIKGTVVVIPFPFSDLSNIKKRPALILADLPDDDILLCQITSQPHNEATALALTASHFVSGSLPVSSFIRPTRIFTASKHIILRKAGTISHALMNNVTEYVVSVLKK
ncbi:MAG: type II toxin-antitoxin system PemK/MazF family toxin [Prevotellaceae bacterium]|jgi:mRNA interferase MazF|nr:type II toxin-antitoxin system PemK/MazF family toxin [Prevotellaceae bacterium]